MDLETLGIRSEHKASERNEVAGLAQKQSFENLEKKQTTFNDTNKCHKVTKWSYDLQNILKHSSLDGLAFVRKQSIHSKKVSHLLASNRLRLINGKGFTPCEDDSIWMPQPEMLELQVVSLHLWPFIAFIFLFCVFFYWQNTLCPRAFLFLGEVCCSFDRLLGCIMFNETSPNICIKPPLKQWIRKYTVNSPWPTRTY